MWQDKKYQFITWNMMVIIQKNNCMLANLGE